MINLSINMYMIVNQVCMHDYPPKQQMRLWLNTIVIKLTESENGIFLLYGLCRPMLFVLSYIYVDGYTKFGYFFSEDRLCSI